MANKTGVVKWFNEEKGYGFISCDEGNDVFLHQSQFKGTGHDGDIHEGNNVIFDVVEGEKGPMATNVQKI